VEYADPDYGSTVLAGSASRLTESYELVVISS